MSRQDIEAHEARWLQAFNGGDASGVARLYVKEFLSMDPTMSFTLLNVHESTDMCAAVGRYEMDLHPPGAEAQKDSGKFIEIWTRQPDGSWLIADDIFNSNLPAPGS